MGIEYIMSKTSELRELSDEQLEFSLQSTQEELFRLRFQAATEKLDTPTKLQKRRQEIARIKTIQRERQLVALQTSQK
jgi:large subunit ribosomal protein L29